MRTTHTISCVNATSILSSPVFIFLVVVCGAGGFSLSGLSLSGLDRKLSAQGGRGGRGGRDGRGERGGGSRGGFKRSNAVTSQNEAAKRL